ncbi:MAG: DUF2079 domain-containing protein, partial [Actinobacteria bacterium]
MAADAIISNRGARLLWPAGVAAATVAFIAVFGWLAVEQLHRFNVFAWDFAIFDQGLWLLSRFQEPFVTVRGLNLFADHSSYVMVLLAPLYWLWAAPEALMLLTVVVLGAGIPITYALARANGAGAPLAALVAAGYLLHPAISWNIWEGFHPELVVVPLVLAAMLLVTRGHQGWALLPVAIALLAKEDVGLLVVPLGIYVAFAMRRRMAGLIMAAAGAGALLLNLAVLLPLLSPSDAPIYTDRYARFGEGIVGVIWGVITHPGAAASELFAPEAIAYAAAIVLPLPLAFLAPRALALALPAYVVNALSSSPYQTDIRYHYTVYLVTAVVIAAAIGAGRLLEMAPPVRRALVTLSVALGLAFGVAVGASPVTLPGAWLDPDPAQDALSAAVALVPDDAVVAAWDTSVPLLSQRREIYVFPVPWDPAGHGEL